MDYLHTIILGFIQGLTEFLPISSSGHIVLSGAIYKLVKGVDFAITSDEEIFFDTLIHLGTLIAVCLYFRNELKDIFKAFFEAVKTRSFKSYNALLPIYIVVGTFFTCIVVFLLADFCEALLTKPNIIGLLLVITGSILFISEFISKKYSQKLLEVDTKKSIWIGITQGLAVIPGISRSGTTIAMALALGIERTRAAKYSFLLSIPVIILATVYQIPDIIKLERVTNLSWGPMLAGAIVSSVVGYFCIKYFIAFLNKFSLNCFAYYCLAIGAAAFVYFQFFAV